jgi:hypothetical protein
VFEIGNSLREARARRGIDFAQAELATKIRGKYLRALEEEQFDLLPAQTYVKGFLRTYAEFLGLDGQLYVDEYNSRFVTGDDHEPRIRRSAARPRRQRARRLETSVVLVALAVVAAITIVVIAGWKMASSPSTNAPTAPRSTAATNRTAHGTPPLLLLVPKRGASYVIAHNGSASGRLRYDGTLQKGDQPLALRGSRLWLQISDPSNLRIEVRGRLVHVPGNKPQVIVVTATGWRPA